MVNLDDNVALVPVLASLGFASIFAMEFAAVLLELAFSQGAHLQALHGLVAELPLSLGDLGLDRRLRASGELPLSSS